MLNPTLSVSIKTVALITDVDFWNRGAGDGERICRLILYLNKHINLYVFYTGRYPVNYGFMQMFNLKCVVFFKHPYKTFVPDEFISAFTQVFFRVRFDACIIEWIHNTHLLSLIPYKVKIILDTHDLIHEKEKSFAQFHLFTSPMEEKNEYHIFNVYDYIMLICSSDYEIARRRMREEKLILAPHCPVLTRRKPRHKVIRIGFIGTDYPPNMDAILYFVVEVWNKMKGHSGVQLHIYGKVGRLLRSYGKNIVVRGVIESIDTIYDEMDIAINPVRFGGGLKIKNIEALANSIPLVTTFHGARGLEQGAGWAFSVADDPQAFAIEIKRLIDDYEYRKSMVEAGYKFVSENFSEHACFGQLLEVINN